MTSAHQCPARGCMTMVRFDHVMCAAHWRLVSDTTKARVYAAWNAGKGYGSTEHVAAREQAVREVNNKLGGL